MQPFCKYTCATISRSVEMRRRSRSGLSRSLGKSSQRYFVALAWFTTSLLSSAEGRSRPLFYIGSHGRRPAIDELMITSGAIEALELVGKSFLDPGDPVVVEGPTYLGAIMAFRSFEAEVIAVPLDEHGLDVDELERRLADGLRPKVVY